MNFRKRIKIVCTLALLTLFLSACSLPLNPTPMLTETATVTPLPSATVTLTLTPSLTASPSPSSTLTPTASPTLTHTPTFTQTVTPSLTPTYALLRGEVVPEHLNCRYGPGVMYLYKYGLLKGNRMEVLGRAENGTWVLVQAIGGDNACWVNSTQLQLNGELTSLEPLDPHIVMAWSPYYPAVSSVAAERTGDEVKVWWSPLALRAGDDSEQTPYVLETWVCLDGQLVFTPVGSWYPWVTVTDQAGCSEPSWGRILAAEKHGYTPWLKVDWPQAE